MKIVRKLYVIIIFLLLLVSGYSQAFEFDDDRANGIDYNLINQIENQTSLIEALPTITLANKKRLDFIVNIVINQGRFFGVNDSQTINFFQNYNKTNACEKQVLIDNLFYAKKIAQIASKADLISKEACVQQHSGGNGDAFRHTLWSAMLAFQFGEDKAWLITAAHERRFDSLATKQEESINFNDNTMTSGEMVNIQGTRFIKNWTTDESKMDQYNNIQGFLLAKEFIKKYSDSRTEQTFKIAVNYFIQRTYEKLNNGELIVLRNTWRNCHLTTDLFEDVTSFDDTSKILP